MDHIRSINGIPDLRGQEIKHPAVVLVDLFRDSDFEESAHRLVTYRDHGGRKEKLQPCVNSMTIFSQRRYHFLGD